MQGFACIWAIKLRGTLMPRSLEFENEIDNSFEEFLKKHFKYEVAHSWNRIQEQVSHIKWLDIRPSRSLTVEIFYYIVAMLRSRWCFRLQTSRSGISLGLLCDFRRPLRVLMSTNLSARMHGCHKKHNQKAVDVRIIDCISGCHFASEFYQIELERIQFNGTFHYRSSGCFVRFN